MTLLLHSKMSHRIPSVLVKAPGGAYPPMHIPAVNVPDPMAARLVEGNAVPLVQDVPS